MTQPMRLAFREEGNRWVCYCAKQHTMQDAIEIGSIGIGAVTRHPDLKAGFMALMKSVLEAAMKDCAGVRVESWLEPTTAPESERSGSA